MRSSSLTGSLPSSVAKVGNVLRATKKSKKRRDVHPRIRWHAAFIAVAAVLRLSRRKFALLPRELAYVENLYDRCNGLNSIVKLRAMLQDIGVQIQDSVLHELLESLRYMDGHVMTFRQFRVFFQYRRLQAMVAPKVADGSAEEAFRAIGSSDDPVQDAMVMEKAKLDLLSLHTTASEFGLQLSLPPSKAKKINFDEFSETVDPPEENRNLLKTWWTKSDEGAWWSTKESWSDWTVATDDSEKKDEELAEVQPRTVAEMLEFNLSHGGAARHRAGSLLFSPSVALGKSSDSTDRRDRHEVSSALPPVLDSNMFMPRDAEPLTSVSATPTHHPQQHGRFSVVSMSNSTVTSPTALRSPPKKEHQHQQLPADMAVPIPLYDDAVNPPILKKAAETKRRKQEKRAARAVSPEKVEEFLHRMADDIQKRGSRPATATAVPKKGFRIEPLRKDCLAEPYNSSPLWKKQRPESAMASLGRIASPSKEPFDSRPASAQVFVDRQSQLREGRKDASLSPKRSGAKRSATVTRMSSIPAPSIASHLPSWTRGGKHADRR